MHQFNAIDYLKTGSATQQKAYDVLVSNAIIKKLQQYGPVLAGTIPLNIDIEGSDLDILCCFDNANEFAAILRTHFSGYSRYKLKQTEFNGVFSIIANFYADGFDVEIFGQPIPVEQQNGYRHMIVEYNILNEKGEEFRREIIRLKQEGMKTEPAFAKLLGLEGDPYMALLEYK